MTGMVMNPMDAELKQLEIAKDQQTINGRDARMGFFDSLQAGGQTPMQGYLAANNPILNPQYRQMLLLQNMQNPNQMQGAANNTGLLLGQAISKMFGPKDQPQLPGQDKQQLYKAQALKEYASLSRQMAPDEALNQVATNMIKRGADLGDNDMILAGQDAYQEYLKMAKQVKEINDFPPVQLTDGNTTTVATSKKQLEALTKQGWRKAVEENPNRPDKLDIRYGTDPKDDTRELAYAVTGIGANGEPSTVRVPKFDRSKIQNTRAVEPGGLSKWTERLSNTENSVSMVNELQDNIAANKAAGGKWTREGLNFLGNVSGTMKAAMGLVGNNPTLDPKNYTDFTTKNASAIKASGLTDAAYIRLAYALASTDKAVQGQTPRASVQETKLLMESLGEHLGDPDTVMSVLEQAKQRMVSQLEYRRDNDLEGFKDNKDINSAIARIKTASRRGQKEPGKGPMSAQDFLKTLPSYNQ